MHIERLAGTGLRILSWRHSPYLLSALLHMGLVLVAWWLISGPAKIADIAHVTEVELVELSSAGLKGGGETAGAPVLERKRLAAPARADLQPVSLPREHPEPEPVPDISKQDRENPEKAVSDKAQPAQEKGDALSGDSRSGSSTGQGSGGRGGGSSTGQGSGEGDSGSGSGAKTDINAYYAAVRARIEAAKRYPLIARKKHLEGNVAVSFALSSDGRLLRVQIVRSSGVDCLDEAALSAVKDGAPYPRRPDTENDRQAPMTVNVAFLLKRL